MFSFKPFSAKSFDIGHVKGNIKELLKLEAGAWLTSYGTGALRAVYSLKGKALLLLKHLCTAGLSTCKTKKALRYTFKVFCRTASNPQDLLLLELIIRKKQALTETLASHLSLVAFPFIEPQPLKQAWDSYKKGSLLQARILHSVLKGAARGAHHPLAIKALQALQEGTAPEATNGGASGSYFIQSKAPGEVIAIFKPSDEEISGPQNPLAFGSKNPIGERIANSGLLVGENIHREVAASKIDKLLNLKSVPTTTYASFTHTAFHSMADHRWKLEAKTKQGSLQEYRAGMKPLGLVSKEVKNSLPIDALHRLVLLDIIIGNQDRHHLNILTDGSAVAAIDNGLSFSDLPAPIFSCLLGLPQLDLPFSVELLQKIATLPVEKLKHTLKRCCYIQEAALRCMEERIALLQEEAALHMTLNEILSQQKTGIKSSPQRLERHREKEERNTKTG